MCWNECVTNLDVDTTQSNPNIYKVLKDSNNKVKDKFKTHVVSEGAWLSYLKDLCTQNESPKTFQFLCNN